MTERHKSVESEFSNQDAADLYQAAYNLMLEQRSGSSRMPRESTAMHRYAEAFHLGKSRVSKEEAIELIEKAKTAAYNLPQGMFLSDEAMAKFEVLTCKYRYFDCDSNNIGEVFKYYPKQNEYSYLKSLSSTDRMKFILAAADDQVIGTTSYNNVGFGMAHVVIQEALREYPGAGLGMLKYLIEIAKKKGSSGIYLHTFMSPIGLGNLGFTPYTDPELPEMPYYQVILREGAKGLAGR